ncbi:MAG TPA: M1 family aminopeptidase [Pyrinomonadaceae bacterium]
MSFYSLPLIMLFTLSASFAQQPVREQPRDAYDIRLKLDFDERNFTGTERVRWINADDRPTSALYFHLYANMRPPSNDPTVDEPRLEVTEVRAADTNAALVYALDDQATTLRVNLRTPVAAGAATEIMLSFKGSVPEIDTEETGILAHIIQQVDAVLRSERETRRARDINFRCRGVMLLGAAYPVLAAREGEDWQRKVETSIGDALFTEVADYRVAIEAAQGVSLFTSGEEIKPQTEGANSLLFKGENLRNFAIIAGRNLRAQERMAAGVRVRSIFTAEREVVGRRVLGIAAEAVEAYAARFGELPFKQVSIAEAPLVAGLGGVEFAGLSAIASAFYVDFDSQTVRNLPELVREQRASVEDSLEWTVAHVVAQQWWGITVGNDPERAPVLDEALSNWSALYYYKEAHGEERAALALEDQLRGVYKIYRTFGGEDMTADHAAHDYRNFFQYAAIVNSKGALMFMELRKLLGDEKFFAALRSYYKANSFEIAEMDDLRGAFIAEAPLAQRRAVTRIFQRWLSSKRGDEDIAPPDPQLAAALGINPNIQKSNDHNAFTRLGKFFWQQMTRIR